MRKISNATAIFVVLNLALICLAEGPNEGAYSSDKPLYAKVALNEDGSKVLTVVFDESKGTGKGYDVLYADVDMSGKLDKAERVEATSFICPSGVHFYFRPIELDAPYNKGGAGVSDPCQVSLSYERHSSKTGTTARLLRSSSAAKTELFTVTSCVRLRDGVTEQEYSFNQNIRPSQSLRDAPVWSFPRNPQVAIITKPDEERKGNLGIGLDLIDANSPGGASLQSGGCGCSSIQMRFQCEPPTKAHVEIKKLDGTVVHRGDATLDKFTFG